MCVDTASNKHTVVSQIVYRVQKGQGRLLTGLTLRNRVSFWKAGRLYIGMLIVHAKKIHENNSNSNNIIIIGYLEHLTRTSPKRLHVL